MTWHQTVPRGETGWDEWGNEQEEGTVSHNAWQQWFDDQYFGLKYTSVSSTPISTHAPTAHGKAHGRFMIWNTIENDCEGHWYTWKGSVHDFTPLPQHKQIRGYVFGGNKPTKMPYDWTDKTMYSYTLAGAEDGGRRLGQLG